MLLSLLVWIVSILSGVDSGITKAVEWTVNLAIQYAPNPYDFWSS